MATKIKDSATAEKAALNLNTGIEVPQASEPNTPREKGTTERLFPDFMTSDGAIINRPVPKDVPAAPVSETVVSAPQTQTPPVQAPTVPTYLKPEELAGKMVKLKVDGIEEDVQAIDLIKLKQLERHSNALLMKVAQERAQIERDRAEFLARSPVDPVKPTKPEAPAKKSPELEAMEAKLAAMEQAFAQQQAMMLPQIQEAGLKRVEQLAKEKTGFDDYRSYHDKVKEIANAEARKAELAGDPNFRRFDTDGFYYDTYKELKLRDLSTKVPAPVPASIPQQGAPVLVNNAGQPVSIPNFESSSGVPSRTSESGDWQSTYNSLLTRAKQSPTDDNWMAVMRHKFRQAE